jgi:hypothetical protein
VDDAADTGNDVCGFVGETCIDVWTLSGADSHCGTDQGPSLFYAFCRP